MPDQAGRAAFEAAVRQNLRDRAALIKTGQAEALQLLRGLAGAIAALLAEQPQDWRQWQLTTIQGQVEALIAGLQGELQAAVDTNLQAVWQVGVASVDAPLAAAEIHVGMFMPVLDTSVLTALRSFTAGRIKDLASSAAAAVDQAVHLAVLGAQTPGDAIKAVRAALGAPDAPTLVRARRIVITSMGQAYASAGQQRLDGAAKVVPDLGKQWRRSGKIHSRWSHDALDGVSVDAGQPFKVPQKGGGFIDMKHPHDPSAPPAEVINCGCVARPWLSRWGLPPGGTPFSEREIALNPEKAATAAWKAGRKG